MTMTVEHSSKTSGTSCSTRRIVDPVTSWSWREERDERLGLALGDAGRGLVEQEQPWAGQHDRRQVDDPARAGRQVPGQVMAEALEAERRDDPVDGLALVRARRAAAHGSCSVVDRTLTLWRASSHSMSVSCTVELGVEAAVLERADEPQRGPLLGDVVGEVLAVEAQRPLRRCDDARHGVEQRGLARPVGPDEPDDRPRLDRHRDLVQGPQPPEGHDQVDDVEAGGPFSSGPLARGPRRLCRRR